MPEGYRVSVIMSPDQAVEIEEVCMRFDGPFPQLVGPVNTMYFEAGYAGLIYYFADERAYGIPVQLKTHKGRPKFWWVFEHQASLAQGRIRSLAWGRRLRHSSPITMAEFAVCNLKLLLEAQKIEDPALVDQDHDIWMAWLVSLMDKIPDCKDGLVSCLPTHETYVDEEGVPSDPYLVHYNVLFTDGSQMLIGEGGYNVVIGSMCLVPQDPTYQKKGAETQYRIVKVQQVPESSMEWRQ